jgi:hypothetical protein
MDDMLVNMLNSIGNGVDASTVDTLLKSPAEYNDTLYQMSLTVASVAVKPIASVVLAIVFTLELARVSSRVDGDRELGVKMVATAMIKIALVFTAAQHSDLLLRAIDQIGEQLMGALTSAAPTTGDAGTMGLGDQMRDAIEDAGWFGQIPVFVLVLIPWLVSKAAWITFTVVMLLRFIQIYMMTAFNPLPIAFIAQEQTQQWGVNYFKQYATLVFQCATLYLAVLMYRVFVADVMDPGTWHAGDSLSGWVLDNFVNLLLASVLLIGTVMVSNGIAKKLFGGE